MLARACSLLLPLAAPAAAVGARRRIPLGAPHSLHGGGGGRQNPYTAPSKSVFTNIPQTSEIQKILEIFFYFKTRVVVNNW